MCLVAQARLLRQRTRPCGPAGGIPAGVFELDAIHRAHRNAQLAPGAIGLDNGVHFLMGAHDGIGGAGLDAQRAADTPGFVDVRHGAWGFHTMLRTQRQWNLPCDGCEAGDALSAPGGALVDGHALFGNGLGVGGAVGIAAACALCLGQGRVDPRRKREDGGS